MMQHELADARWSDLLLWILRRRRRFRVTGASMLPLLQPGEEVLVDPRAFRHKRPLPGDLVVAQHPHRQDLKIIKRVAFVEENGRCYLQGLNPRESSDSRTFGTVPITSIIGLVTSRFP